MEEERENIYITLDCHHKNDSPIRTGSGAVEHVNVSSVEMVISCFSDFNVPSIAWGHVKTITERGKVTRECP